MVIAWGSLDWKYFLDLLAHRLLSVFPILISLLVTRVYTVLFPSVHGICMGKIMSLQGVQLHNDSEFQEEIWVILSSYQIEFLVAIEFIILSVLKVNTLLCLIAGVWHQFELLSTPLQECQRTGVLKASINPV